jgi:hypothetical protein
LLPGNVELSLWHHTGFSCVDLPAVPLPPLPADDAAEDGVQATDSAALTASGVTGSGLGTDAGVRCDPQVPLPTVPTCKLLPPAVGQHSQSYVQLPGAGAGAQLAAPHPTAAAMHKPLAACS